MKKNHGLESFANYVECVIWNSNLWWDLPCLNQNDWLMAYMEPTKNKSFIFAKVWYFLTVTYQLKLLH